MPNLFRAIGTTFKQIRRSGWLSWASISVMTLSFIVAIVFVGLAYVLNLVLQSIENEPHIYIFYQAGTEEEMILETKREWEDLSNIESIEYTSELDALSEFKAYNERSNPITAEAIRENVLPASLGIRLKAIEGADEVIEIVKTEEESNESVLSVGYSETVIENIKEIVNIARFGGIVILLMLVIVILLFTFLTVEFKIYFRSEEIGVMQLVGGSLWYIRLPFLLESAIYGILGAIFSNLIIAGSYYAITKHYSQSNLLQFVNRFFGNLAWPIVTEKDLIIVVLGMMGTGALIGIIFSFIAIRRYIK